MGRRIAVVGAGPAGLTAARRLKQHGHHRVTVLERQSRVGGKCHTLQIDGRSYEAGAVLVGRTTYTVVQELLTSLELGTRAAGKTQLLRVDEGGPPSILVFLKDYLTRYRPALKRYLASLDGTPSFRQPGYLAFDPETFGRTFLSWVQDHDAEAALDIIRPMYTGFGYGYLETAPVPHVLKIYDRERLEKALAVRPFGGPRMLTIDVGYEGLCRRMAETLDVRCGIEIHKIRRDQQVHITTDDGTQVFDDLILACPLHKIRGALDTRQEERTLFDQIITEDYQTVMASVEGLGDRGLVFFTDNMTADRAGRLVCGYRRWSDTNIWALYVLSDRTHDDGTILDRVREDLEAVGATLGAVHSHHKWDFYPHVSAASFQAGFYSRLEALQGRNHTYITGEIVASASVESVAGYSIALIDKHFGPTDRPPGEGRTTR